MRIVGFVGLILLLSILSPAQSARCVVNQGESLAKTPNFAQYEEILIESNADFVSQGWPGNGSLASPFLISGLSFDTNAIAIQITNTNASFIISDCIFTSSTDANEGQGIKLWGMQNGLIKDCNFSSINSGIQVEFVENCTISGCTVVETNIPLTFHTVNSSNIIDNSLFGPVMIYEAHDCLIQSNTQSRFQEWEDMVGLQITYSERCIIDSNTICNNDYGVWIGSCEDIVLENNVFVNNGLIVKHPEANGYEIDTRNNTVNGKPMVYLYDESDRQIDASSYGQVIIASCDNVTIQNGHFDNATAGVIVAHSVSCNILGVSVIGNVYGISFDSSVGCFLNTSSIIDNQYGVLLTDLSTQIRIYNNSIMRNSVGISFSSAYDCEVIGNLVTDNDEIGIGVGGEGSWICYNTLGRNGINAVDYGTANSWDNGVDLGNYWDDMIAGEVYLIPGDAESVDRFPNGTAGSMISPDVLVIIAAGMGIVLFIGCFVNSRKR